MRLLGLFNMSIYAKDMVFRAGDSVTIGGQSGKINIAAKNHEAGSSKAKAKPKAKA